MYMCKYNILIGFKGIASGIEHPGSVNYIISVALWISSMSQVN